MSGSVAAAKAALDGKSSENLLVKRSSSVVDEEQKPSEEYVKKLEAFKQDVAEGNVQGNSEMMNVAVVSDIGWKNATGADPTPEDVWAQYDFKCAVSDVLEYAEYLGMDIREDAHLLWIADEALQAPEPQGWEQRLDPKGGVYYYHPTTGMSLNQHPLDHHYQQFYLQMKAQYDAMYTAEKKQKEAAQTPGGDAGASVYAISLEDKMFNVFGSDKMGQLSFAFEIAGDDGEPLQSDMLTKSLSTIQEKVESYYREMRTNLVRYDRIVDAQRRIFYERRQEVLTGDRAFLSKLLGQYAADTARDTLANATRLLPKDASDDEKNQAYEFGAEMLQRMYPACAVEIDTACRLALEDLPPTVAPDIFTVEDSLVSGTQKGFDLQVALVDQKGEGEDDLPAILMRFYILREFDQAWQQHLRDLEFLRENVGFQSYSQKDPFQEWTIQSNELFTKLSAKVYRNSAISWLSLDASGIVARPAAPVAPASPVVSDDDDVSNPVAAAQARGAASLNANDQTGEVAGNRGERRAKKKGGKKSRRR